MSKIQAELKPTAAPGARIGPSPERIFEVLTAYQQTAALKAGIELDLFSQIGDGRNTVQLLANRIKASERGVRVLCDCLVVLGFLTKLGDRYGLTADSAVFLDKKSPSFAGSMKNFLASPVMIEGFTDLAGVVRTGRPLHEAPFSGTEHSIWVEFARSMAPFIYRAAQETAKLLSQESRIKLLDIAAGHGLFGIIVAQLNPKARIVALDFPAVLTVAHANAMGSGVSDRYTLLPGNALDVELGSGFDVVLIPNLMHSLDRATNERLLQKVHGSLAPQGQVIVVEFTPNEDRISPRLPALFALMMLANNHGDAYTIAEHRAMLNRAGLAVSQVHSLPPTPFTAIVATKG